MQVFLHSSYTIILYSLLSITSSQSLFIIVFLYSDQYWTPYNIRNGRLANMCSKEQSSFALWFGDQITLSLNQDVTMISHAAVTNGVSPINIICEELQSIQPVICTVLEQNDTVNISNSSFEKFEQNITQMV